MSLAKNKANSSSGSTGGMGANLWFVSNASNIRISRIPEAVLDDLITFTDDQLYCLSEDVVMSYFWELFYDVPSHNFTDEECEKIGEEFDKFLEQVRRRDFPHYGTTADMLKSLTHRVNSFLTIIVIARRSGSTKINDLMLWDCVYEDSKAAPVLKKTRARTTKSKAKSRAIKSIKATLPKSARTGHARKGEGHTLLDCARAAFLAGDMEEMKRFISEIKKNEEHFGRPKNH